MLQSHVLKTVHCISFFVSTLLISACSKSKDIDSKFGQNENHCNVLTYEIYTSNPEKLSSKDVYTYDLFGNLIKRENIAGIGLITDSKTFRHDLNAQNKPIKSLSYDMRGDLISTAFFEYNTNFSLKSKIIYYPVIGSNKMEKFEYNEFNRLIYYQKTSESSSSGVENFVTFNSAGLLLKDEQFSNKKRTNLIENTYDSKNRLTKSVTINFLNYVTEVSYSYNNQGNITELKTNQNFISKYNYSRGLLTERSDFYQGKKHGGIKYSYDGNSRVVRTYKSYDSQNYPKEKEFKYYPNGKLKQRLDYSLKSGSRTETYLSNEELFDSYGNTTKKTGYEKNGSEMGKIIIRYSCSGL